MFDAQQTVPVPALHPLYRLELRLDEALYRGESYRLIEASLNELSAFSRQGLNHAYRQLDQFGADAGALLTPHYRRLLGQIHAWAADYGAGQPVLAAEIVHYLRGWRRDHLQLLDGVRQAA